jgi:aryl-alcohol dehydrogenase-like predicted oxidoreductase
MELVLGTMYFGTRTDEPTSFALLDRFVEAGGRVLDTANCYAFWVSDTGHGGQSETVIGRWLGANPGLRDELVIATKVGVEPVDSGGVEGLSAEVIAREARLSRERLGIETIDVYWAHAEDRHVDLAETVGAFGALVEEGVVRRSAAPGRGAGQGPPVRLRHRRDGRLPREPSGDRAVGLQPADPGQLRPG